MVILGIDPGIERTGFGVLCKEKSGLKVFDFGCIITSRLLPFSTRLHEIVTDVQTLIKKWHPDCAVIEELFFSKNVKTAMKVAQSRGALLELFEERGIPVYQLNPGTIKAAVSGNGRASKIQIRRMVERLLNMQQPIKFDDTADALAAALCFGQTNQTLYSNNIYHH